MLILNWIKRRLRKCCFTLNRLGSDGGRGTRSATFKRKGSIHEGQLLLVACPTAAGSVVARARFRQSWCWTVVRSPPLQRPPRWRPRRRAEQSQHPHISMINQ